MSLRRTFAEEISLKESLKETLGYVNHVRWRGGKVGCGDKGTNNLISGVVLTVRINNASSSQKCVGYLAQMLSQSLSPDSRELQCKSA